MGARNFYAGLFLALAATSVIGSSASAGPSPNVLLNGDFEHDPSGSVPRNWQVEPGPPADIWVLQGSDYSGVTGSTSAMNNHFIAFGPDNRPNNQALYQNFPTVIGQVYRISFDAGALGTGSEQLSTTVTKTGNGTELDYLVITTVADNDLDTTFAPYRYNFTATGAESALFFIGVGPGINIDPILDNVSVTAVPEPATWEFFVLGIGLLGFTLRRRAIPLAK